MVTLKDRLVSVLHMNKYCFFILIIMTATHAYAGVTVLGTRFVIYAETKKLKINLNNDNHGDFLIKSNIVCDNDDKFIVVPPLFILLRERSNSITIIPNSIQQDNKDHICNLTIASIPKSKINDSSTVSVAIRNNLPLIYRHDKLENVDLTRLKLITDKTGHFLLLNDTNFALTLKINLFEKGDSFIKKTLHPYGSIPIKECNKSTCSLWISVVNDDESIFKKIHLSSL